MAAFKPNRCLGSGTARSSTPPGRSTRANSPAAQGAKISKIKSQLSGKTGRRKALATTACLANGRRATALAESREISMAAMCGALPASASACAMPWV